MDNFNQPDDDEMQLQLIDLDASDPGQGKQGAPQRFLQSYFSGPMRRYIMGGALLMLVGLLFVLILLPILTSYSQQRPLPTSLSATLMLVATTSHALYLLDSATGSMEAAAPDTGRLLWRVSPAWPLRPPVILANGTLYCIAYTAQESHVYALSAKNGQLLWQHPLSSVYPLAFLHGQQSLYLLVRGIHIPESSLLALSMADGSLLWRRQIDISARANANLALGSDALYLNTSEGELLQAFRLHDGALLWRYASRDATWFVTSNAGITYVESANEGLRALRTRDGSELWHYQGGVNGLPPFAHGVVYLFSPDGAVEAVRMSDGTRLWRYRGAQSLWGTLQLSENKLLVCSGEGTIATLQASDGRLLWQTRLKSLPGQPFVSPGIIYLCMIDGSLFALQASTGHILWHINAGTLRLDQQAIQEEGKLVYLVAQDGLLSAVQRETGRELWQIKGLTASPYIQNENVYVCLRDGSLTVLRAVTGRHLWRLMPSPG
ncbi:hypothetical protein EPA93_02600 [Ktedonosporobacter rubrisoli]|uniref:Pyrrolo-quinoline quinone repeat domain-containing protein n=1 Tax=Ktedonosporobacter rubrisoli TaxID=2509675 RepID=A0A4P6JIN0_KTERU|nr:PQQ-binding-like beta-propeller repeat protein [Ktedonosporobacter rubrisoli]QBD74937.1 hypothetical protein EPA93_02600 [Ktedonosporobacter rubrisoli]